MEPEVTIGRIVHYKLAEGVIRPAMVVAVNSPGNVGSIQVQVFLDGSNDGPRCLNLVGNEEADRGLAWRTSVSQGDGVDQWQWPHRADNSPEETVEEHEPCGEGAEESHDEATEPSDSPGE